MENNYTVKRGRSSTTGAIPIHHIFVGDGNDAGSGNVTDDADNSILSPFPSSHWVLTTKKTTVDILQLRVVRVKSRASMALRV